MTLGGLQIAVLAIICFLVGNGVTTVIFSWMFAQEQFRLGVLAAWSRDFPYEIVNVCPVCKYCKPEVGEPSDVG